ncbi:vesicle-associated membrane protein 7-like [Hydractinia symbiolongicarpus]|uniref:vesicle-associated membrane protein 7-like n=1 Tax=Hydractinia symbiolongicarpus TaxID=13093 RepID=UPI00254C6355|nr:vesicle-associated membrane protein 7-like [Hydractinia symbiolongicarpus]
MPLLYSTVARGTTVLAKHASCSGNFQEITEHILLKIDPGNEKMTFTQPGYLFHYISESGIIYLCISDDTFDRTQSFLFLAEVKRRFTKTYQQRAATALPYAMQSEFSRVLASEMRHFSNPSDSERTKMQRVEEEIDELKGIMINNIDSIAQRGEKLELLVEKTDDLNATSMTFKKSSKSLARAMFMKNLKLIIAVIVVLFVLILIIVFASCGTDWSHCGKN